VELLIVKKSSIYKNLDWIQSRFFIKVFLIKKMNNKRSNIIPAILVAVICSIIFSCKNNNIIEKANFKNTDSFNTNKTKTFAHKPFSSFQDTLKISKPSAVFYHPDSSQLEKIKQQTDSIAYKDLIHVHFFFNSKFPQRC
jgi:hypothetical protein